MKKMSLYLIVSALVLVTLLLGRSTELGNWEYWTHFQAGSVCFTLLVALMSMRLYRESKSRTALYGVVGLFVLSAGTLAACLC